MKFRPREVNAKGSYVGIYFDGFLLYTTTTL
jgi:hypothetical protein